MNFLVFSEKELTQTPKYSSFNKPHLLISITNPGAKVRIPKTHYCKETLNLEFLDIEDIGEDSFDQGIARNILDFVNSHSDGVHTIVVHCGAGLSRSVAVASALSKIINHRDDSIFSYGIPNMLVYNTILETYFMDKAYDLRWSSIYFMRDRNMKELLEPAINRIREYKVKKRREDKGE